MTGKQPAAASQFCIIHVAVVIVRSHDQKFDLSGSWPKFWEILWLIDKECIYMITLSLHFSAKVNI